MCLKLVLKRFTTDERSSVTVTVSHGMHCFLLFIEELGIECQVVKYVFHCVQVLMNIIYYTFPLVKIKSVLKKYQICLAYMYMGYLFLQYLLILTIFIIFIYIYLYICFIVSFKMPKLNRTMLNSI